MVPMLEVAARNPGLLETIVESMPARVFWKDRASRYLGCNTAFARDAGAASPAEIVGRTDRELGWRAQADRYRADDLAVMESGVSRLGYEEPQTTPDGATSWLRTSKVPLRDGQGEVIGVLGIYDDITAERAAQDALRLTQFANDHSRDAICRIDCTGRFEYVNAAFCELVGCTPDDLPSPAILDLDRAHPGEAFRGRWAELIAAGSARFETQLRHRDGHAIAVEVSADRVSFGDRELVVAFLRDVRHRNAQEAELRASERRFRDLVEQSPVATRLVATDRRTLRVNRAWERLWGAPAASVEGLSLADDPRFATRGLWPEIQRAFQGESVVVPPGQCEGAGGATIWVRTQLYPVRGDDGAVREVVITHEDLTEQVQSERALRESERRFQVLFEESPDPCWLVGEDNRSVLCNRAAAARLGYGDRTELLALHPADVSPPNQPDGRDSRAAADEMIARTLAQGVHRFEWTHLHRDGSTFPAEVTLARIEIGGRPRLYAVWRDISERKAQERALLESRRLHEEAQRIAHVGHWQLDHRARTLQWSDETYRIFGLDPRAGGVTYEAMFHAIHPDERARVEATYARAVAERTTYAIAHRVVHPDGTERWIQAIGELMFDGGDEPVRATGTVTDITERRRAELAQAKLHARLEATQRLEAVGRLAGGVAHDFNNMLAVILGSTALAIEEIPAEHAARADLAEVMDAAQRSAELTRQLLAFARRQTVSPIEIDLDEKIGGLIKMLRRLIGEDIALEWVPAGHLAAVRIDPSQVDQVLANLCVNARDAIGGRGGTVRIETANVMFHAPDAADDLSPHVRVTVTDTGCGMDEATLANLFEPFFTTKGVGEGTGLGLATVYGIVTQNSGHLEVSSAPGRGSTFRIYLPAVATAAVGAAAPAVDLAPRARSAETVLLVEDEPAMMRFTRRVLERLGYLVLAASSGDDALQQARAHRGPLHLLISDVIMPGMCGWDLSRQLLVEHPRMQILFMSGYTADILAPHGVLSQDVAFIQKPFTVSDLAARVRGLIEGTASAMVS
ncbi:MAG: PAS domain S-box protein [Deltaproteobacteria bacterium]|nr:PAS domain S-box protein [Deltaproteobacteria bacterium]